MLWVLNVLIDCGGQLAFKAAASDRCPAGTGSRWAWMARRPWMWVGIGCYAVEFLLWLAFLSLLPLSEGVLLGAVNTVALMVAGRLFFGERISPLRLTGILLISAGVAVVGLWSA